MMRRPDRQSSVLQSGSVLSVGTFDGLHLGHQRILQRVIDEARARQLPSMVFSFEPTPREFFSYGAPPARLTRFREKFEALQRFGIEWFFCPPFDGRMESLEPDEFIEGLLVNELGVRHLVVGDDFVFGRNRSGNIDHLRAGGERFGFSVEQVQSVLADGQRVSSTRVRELLAAGEMRRAKQLLGRYYGMTGRVVDGQKLGKQLGYPTANVNLNRRASPIAGIFAVRVGGLDSGLLDGVASVGTRPTIDGIEPILEVHIFDFDRDIYGEYIQVQFVAKLRDEVKFPDLETLTGQMHIDAAQARKILT
jgi:riboflavin kinase/FMN adenylyltransferase